MSASGPSGPLVYVISETSYEAGLKKFLTQQRQDGNLRAAATDPQRSRDEMQAAYKKQMYAR